ncbi:multiple sugar transport system permease protein [Agromyces terreus]|uniref:Multiple sugar transport system permease protein n=1 Tax=Agromyces terreus TaxID=424795 RepID=A0A9X2H400_9MICO|nr:carbohydrate ABC transporter permease [Agromyces terreus]MCP2369649.1 multiple sugar transport system permease protein [Agromyces terreus]
MTASLSPLAPSTERSTPPQPTDQQPGARRRAPSHSGFSAGWSRTVIVGLVTALLMIPFMWMISIAFKGPTETYSYPPKLIPESPTWENFVQVWTVSNLSVGMVNSLIVAVLAVAGNCIGAVAAGYAFAKIDFRGSKLLFLLVLATAMVPAVVQLIPLFLLVQDVPLVGGNDVIGQGGTGLLNTHLGLALPLLIQPLNIYLARQYFLDMPDEIADAGRIDGASEFRIFWNLYLPLAKPIVATIAILSFTGAWEDFLWPLVSTSSSSMQTLPLVLSSFTSSGAVQYGPMMASAIVASLPVVVLFLLTQRHFVNGLSAGGVKG